MTSRIKLWNLRLYIFTSTMHNFQTEKSRGFLLAKNSEALAYHPIPPQPYYHKEIIVVPVARIKYVQIMDNYSGKA